MEERNKHMPFEPEKWDSSKYDLYMDWCGGVSYSGSDDIPNKFVDNFDMQNLKNEDNLYKKLKGYICMCRRYLEYQGYPRPEFLTEEFVEENMNDFRQLLKENINEILINLSMTKWLYSIIICFIDLGTDEEKTKCKLLVSLMQLNRINLNRSRTLYSEDEVTQQYEKDFLINNIVPLEDKSFESVISVLMDNDMVKVLKNYE
tara:strand:+ start:102 stop:710 length:609 start_codon:yes stop_codon:yes gene_type:complete